jgi:hypothetical protein
LRRFASSRPERALLLHKVICDEKVANNGEVFIDISGSRKIISFDP